MDWIIERSFYSEARGLRCASLDRGFSRVACLCHQYRELGLPWSTDCSSTDNSSDTHGDAQR